MPTRNYQKQKRLPKEARERYENLYEKEKRKSEKKVCKKYQSFPEEEKDKKGQFKFESH